MILGFYKPMVITGQMEAKLSFLQSDKTAWHLHRSTSAQESVTFRQVS
jgi:hypothetical protein